jgi:hypothetical protein
MGGSTEQKVEKSKAKRKFSKTGDGGSPKQNPEKAKQDPLKMRNHQIRIREKS